MRGIVTLNRCVYSTAITQCVGIGDREPMETVMCIEKTTDEAIAYEGLVRCSISGRQGTYMEERAGLDC